MELLLVLPILMAVVLGMIQFSLLISARQQVTSAAREAGRVAALGGSNTEIQATVDRFFGSKVATVQTAIADLNGQPILPGDPVTVVVRVRTSCLVPELLKCVGFSMKNQELVARAVMRKE
jgi:Flp pilus assembly protein TadG